MPHGHTVSPAQPTASLWCLARGAHRLVVVLGPCQLAPLTAPLWCFNRARGGRVNRHNRPVVCASTLTPQLLPKRPEVRTFTVQPPESSEFFVAKLSEVRTCPCQCSSGSLNADAATVG